MFARVLARVIACMPEQILVVLWYYNLYKSRLVVFTSTVVRCGAYLLPDFDLYGHVYLFVYAHLYLPLYLHVDVYLYLYLHLCVYLYMCVYL